MWEITRLRSFRNKPTHVGRKLSINMSPPLPPQLAIKTRKRRRMHIWGGGGNRYRAAAGDNTRNSNIKSPLTHTHTHTHTPAPPLSTCFLMHAPCIHTAPTGIDDFCISVCPCFQFLQIEYFWPYHMYSMSDVTFPIVSVFYLLQNLPRLSLGKGREKGETARRPWFLFRSSERAGAILQGSRPPPQPVVWAVVGFWGGGEQ